MMNLLICVALLPKTGQTPVAIGTHYTDGLAGLVVYSDPTHSVLLNFAWVGPDGKLASGYKALVDAKVHFGEAAPDDSYHRISWSVGKATLTYEWGRIGANMAVGRLSSTDSVEVRASLTGAWPGIKPVLASNPDRVVVRADQLKVGFDVVGNVMPSGETSDTWAERFLVSPTRPIKFSLGTGSGLNPALASRFLDTTRTKYLASRLSADGDWGNFVSPFQNQLGNTKIYSPETGRLAHIVSRGWCLPDGQVLFCWDSFFNGLMASFEDPNGAKQTLRAILAAATPEGFIPNYAGRGWGVSSDRSQPPVGSYCIWKVHQRDPDLAFLKEAYPKLLKWHRWWFSKKANVKHPTRDGNRDGLLEWGTTTGDLQNAKYESGLDDSPMFDDGAMVGPNMNLDATDLNALYAFDADYLAKIATALGKKQEAASLLKEKAVMERRMDSMLWNEKMGAYCYRYWTPKPVLQEVPLEKACRSGDLPGWKGEYFQGREVKGDATIRHDAKIEFSWDKGPLPGFGPNNYSVRWTTDFTAPKAGRYQFHAESDDGCRVWIDGAQVIEGWSVHGLTKYNSAVLVMKAGEKHKIRMEYFQGDGGAEVRLKLVRTDANIAPATFSSRLSPLNFYPLIVDTASKAKARRTLDLFFRPDQFGGTYVCPTVSRSDPAYPAQGYWRGTVWGPTSYLTYQGLRRYATNAELTDYAEKSVKLFMKNWIADGSCHENFNSITGWGRSDPHYTWGALLCLLGLEQLCDTTPDGRVVLNGASGRHIRVHNLRIAGKLYDLAIEPRKAVLTAGGKVVAVARNRVAKVRLGSFQNSKPQRGLRTARSMWE